MGWEGRKLLSGVDKKDFWPQSRAGCIPMGNQILPVGFKANAASRPKEPVISAPNHDSPSFGGSIPVVSSLIVSPQRNV